MPRLSELSPDFVTQEDLLPLTQNANTPIMTAEASRFSFMVSGTTANQTFFITTDGSAPANKGIFIGSTFLYLTMTYRDYGPLICGPWFAHAAGINQSITLIQVFYRPRGRPMPMEEVIAALDGIGGVQ